MKYVAILVFVSTAFLAKGGIHADTITYWVMDYDKTTVIRGSLISRITPRHEITVQAGSVKNLTIAFVYDSGQPKTSSLTVKERSEVLRTFTHDPDMGSYFVVPIKELIGTHQSGVRYELDFYYTDDRGQENLKLGTLVFIFKE